MDNFPIRLPSDLIHRIEEWQREQNVSLSKVGMHMTRSAAARALIERALDDLGVGKPRR